MSWPTDAYSSGAATYTTPERVRAGNSGVVGTVSGGVCTVTGGPDSSTYVPSMKSDPTMSELYDTSSESPRRTAVAIQGSVGFASKARVSEEPVTAQRPGYSKSSAAFRALANWMAKDPSS